MASLTPYQLRADIADVLGEPVDDLADDDDLFDYGVDSIRLMTLVERWRAAGAEASFVTLAERPTVAAWSELLS
jgi:bifunctional isochorismate lyase/aryl carrier protein